MKRMGLILLLIGFGMIAYAFKPSDAMNPIMAHVHTGISTITVLWLLVGGSGATVVGVTMMFRCSGRLQK